MPRANVAAAAARRRRAPSPRAGPASRSGAPRARRHPRRPRSRRGPAASGRPRRPASAGSTPRTPRAPPRGPRTRRGGPTRPRSARRRGPVRVEVAGVLVRLHDERRALAPARGRRRRRSRSAHAGSSAPDERRRVRAARREHPDEPARRSCSCRACRRPRRASGRAAASATTCCHGSSGMPAARGGRELRVVGIDRGEGLGDREPVRRRPASRTWAGVVAAGDVDAGAPRAPACTGWRRRGRSRRPTPRPTAARSAAADAPAPARADDVDPLARRGSGARGTRGRQARPDRRGRVRPDASCGAAAGRRSTRASSSSIAATALSRLFALRSPGHRYRRTSAPEAGDRDVHEARPASPRSRRPGPATPVTPTPRSAPQRARARPRPSRRRPARDTAPCASSAASGTPSSVGLDVVRVGDDPAAHVARTSRAPR